MISGKNCSIFWDLENCPPARGTDPITIISALRDRFLPVGPIKQIYGYARLSRIPERLKVSLQASGCHLIDVPIQRKDVADKMIISDMVLFAVDNPVKEHHTQTIILISGDQDFAYPLAKLHMRGYQIALIVPTGGAAEILKRQADFVYEWTEFSFPYSASELPSEEAQTSIAFEPLLHAINSLQNQSIERPLFSQVGKTLNQLYPHWRQRNVQNLSEYITFAVEAGLVKSGGIAPQFWVQLDQQRPYEGLDFSNPEHRFLPLLDVMEQAKDSNIEEPELAWIGSQLRFICPNWRELTGHYLLISYIKEAEEHDMLEIRNDGLQHYVSLPLTDSATVISLGIKHTTLQSDIELLQQAWTTLRVDEIVPTEGALIGRMRELRSGWFLQTSSFRSVRGLIRMGEEDPKILYAVGEAPYRIVQPADQESIEGYNPNLLLDDDFSKSISQDDYHSFIKELSLFSIFSAKGRYKMAKLLLKQLPSLHERFSLGKILVIIQMALIRGDLSYSDGEILWNKPEDEFFSDVSIKN